MKSKVVLVLGVALILLSFGWGYLVPTSWFWDDARATELNNLSVSLHDAIHTHEDDHHDDHDDDHHGHHHDDHFGEQHADDSPKVAAATKKYQAAQAELATAKLWANSMPTYLRWSGLSLCLVGVALYAAAGNDK